MQTDDQVATDVASEHEREAPAAEPFDALARWIADAKRGDRAALTRLQADALQPHQLAALSRALLSAGLSPDRWDARTWPRWALIAQGMALAGHDGKRALGWQLAQAGVAESRVTKLLTARAEAFTQIVPRLLRLLASQGVSPNWRELGELVLIESSDSPDKQAQAESLRLHIAGRYFSERAKAAA